MEFREKVSSLLKHLYKEGGREYQSFELLPVRDYLLGHAANADEFEAIVDHAQANSWLKWARKTSISGGRIVYSGVQFTPLGIEETENAMMLFDDVATCPLTGLPLQGRAIFTPLDGSKHVLYSFAPIGKAVFERNHLLGLNKTIANGNQKPRLDLAGRCREAMERGQSPMEMTYAMFTEAQLIGPKTFEEKQAHFLRLLYETGSNEYKERDININNDFPLAFATNAEEFTRILKALLSKGLLEYNKPNDTANDWVGGIRTHYPSVLLTPIGEQRVINSLHSQEPVSMSATTTSNLLDRIFISHSSKDANIVEEIIDLLEIMGITKPKQIFCSSFQGYSIGLGEDFLQRIKDELNGNILVLFVITPNFYKSPVSLCEMGAAWVKTSKHIPIVVPPLGYKDVEGVIPLTQGFIIDEPLKWNTLKEQIEQWFAIQNTASMSIWERKRDKAIQAITKKIHDSSTLISEQKPIKPPRRGGSISAI